MGVGNLPALVIGLLMIAGGALLWWLNQKLVAEKASGENVTATGLPGLITAAKELSVPQLLIVFGFVLVLISLGLVSGQFTLTESSASATP